MLLHPVLIGFTLTITFLFLVICSIAITEYVIGLKHKNRQQLIDLALKKPEDLSIVVDKSGKIMDAKTKEKSQITSESPVNAK